MSDRDFIRVLSGKLASAEEGRGPKACSWDDVDRVMSISYDVGGPDLREIRLALPVDAVVEFAGGLMDDDVRDVWGDGVDSVEGAARFATIFLEELVQRSGSEVTRLELTRSGIRPVG